MISLPLPPSTNDLFRNVRGVGRVRTSAYRKWATAAGWQLKAQRPECVTGPYRLEITIPLRMRGDASNRIKAVEDLLVEHSVTPDDSKAHAILIERSRDVAAGWCKVTVRAVEVV